VDDEPLPDMTLDEWDEPFTREAELLANVPPHHAP
jgi:hypothetical protein